MTEKTRAQILGENLERIRKERGKSRKELAAAVGVNEVSFGKYERGDSSPNYERLFILAEKLNCSVADILGDNPAVKGKEVWQWRFERSIEILNRIGFLIEEDGDYLTIKEKPKINISNNEITTTPKKTRKFIKHLLNILVADVENFALEKDISFKTAFQYLIFSEKSPYNPQNNFTDYTEDKLNNFINDYK